MDILKEIIVRSFHLPDFSWSWIQEQHLREVDLKSTANNISPQLEALRICSVDIVKFFQFNLLHVRQRPPFYKFLRSLHIYEPGVLRAGKKEIVKMIWTSSSHAYIDILSLSV